MRWSGVSPRFEKHETQALSTYDGLEDTGLIDWPLRFEELEHYYDLAEDKMGVSGTHGTPASAENNNYKVLKAGAQKIGYSRITSGRMSINSVARHGRPACRQIGFCNSGCAIGAKWSTLYTEIPAAEKTGHFELRSECMVMTINHDKAGRVSGVVYRVRRTLDGTLDRIVDGFTGLFGATVVAVAACRKNECTACHHDPLGEAHGFSPFHVPQMLSDSLLLRGELFVPKKSRLN